MSNKKTNIENFKQSISSTVKAISKNKNLNVNFGNRTEKKDSNEKNPELLKKESEGVNNQNKENEISINPQKVFKYISSNLDEESDFERESCFALGIYCLQKKEKVIAQSVFKRLLMRDKENTDLRCFLVLAISLNGDAEKAIKTLQGILGRKPNHRYTNVNMGILLKNKGYIQQARVSFFNTFRLLERSQGSYEINNCLEKADKFFIEGRNKKALEIKLDNRSKYLRKLIVKSLIGGGRGHMGSAMSLVEIFHFLKSANF